ncbi:Peptidoglycan/LPS O-acetylase OafA/YrhL, contains acyltransferase and SGNH-hydrolase domains [Pseudomonas cuatrocienegasensis]|uniref:Peptidoglycan/LPS O-acetylase OafA/YrhL, contains acyltransferase and SGNH-hydrolase domains n=1 Tax=Pseudomonas cuatrocienegasensis TaxID=543360 RepID=A0ABY1BF71_9PSED|nr:MULTISPECIES: acyltransferase [Pseudomonas]OEC36000.1 acyltransferase [Pseudomonas sp. 21C1]SEQ72224.1 Peptidoglycan/LPS O-acetylase OafA/YrhL, contains acyltransferase and SGNH-hydrolase domains [Pseudomonas cuatrocienegasensis]
MLYSVQALRAFAAWLVVFHHVMQVFFDFQAESATGWFLAERGAIGVDIFFVISGLVIYLSTRDKVIAPGRFLLNRALRIVPAYWLYTLLAALLIAYANPVMPTQQFDLQHLLRSLLFIPAENPAGFGLYPTLNVGWTLNYEMFFYLLFAFSVLAPERLRLPLLAALLLLSTGLAAQPWVSGFYANAIVYEFLLGVALGVAYSRGWIVPARLWPMLALLGAALAIYLFDSSNRLLHWGLPSALLVAACLALEPYFRTASWLKGWGDCSYSVYLVHVLVLSLGWYAAQRFELPVYAVIAACMPVIAVLGWASYALIERRLFSYARARLDDRPGYMQRSVLS